MLNKGMLSPVPKNVAMHDTGANADDVPVQSMACVRMDGMHALSVEEDSDSNVESVNVCGGVQDCNDGDKMSLPCEFV